MTPRFLFTPHVEKLKQYARKLKKELGVPHHVALNQAAQKINCHHWHHVIQLLAITHPTEEAYKNGLLFACDFSEANFDADFFVEDCFAEELFQQMRIELDPQKNLSSELAAENRTYSFYSDLDSLTFEHLEQLRYFRFIGTDVPLNIEGALTVIRKDFSFPPYFVRLKGKIFDLHAMYLMDKKGNIDKFVGNFDE